MLLTTLLHWFIGLTFMLIMTVLILQLREVFHPEIMAPYLRPHEMNPDVFSQLLKGSYGSQLSRVLIAQGVYMLLVLLLVYVPLSFLGPPSSFHWHSSTYYVFPELQLVLELGVFQYFALSVVDSEANILGVVERKWFIVVCRQLGLSRHLLPCLAIMTVPGK